MGGHELTEEHVDRYVYEILTCESLRLHPFVYLMNAHGLVPPPLCLLIHFPFFSFELYSCDRRCDKECRSARHEPVKTACAVSVEQLSRYAALLLTVPDFVPRADNCAQVLADSLLNAGVHYADRIFFLQQVWVIKLTCSPHLTSICSRCWWL